HCSPFRTMIDSGCLIMPAQYHVAQYHVTHSPADASLMTTFALLVLGAPHSTASEQSAWHFAEAAVASGHRLFRVFFFHDGVQAGSTLQLPAAEERSVPERWAQLARDHGID